MRQPLAREAGGEGGEAQRAMGPVARRVEIDAVLTSGKSHILKRKEFPLSDIVSDCQVSQAWHAACHRLD